MKPFSELQSNLKSMARVGSYPLGPCTAFVGRNRSGKTAALDSIRLALTGKHAVGHHGSSLVELAADPQRGLEVVLSGASGIAKLRVPVVGRKAKTPAHGWSGEIDELTYEQREHVLPTASMHELVELGVNRGRRAVFQRFGDLKVLPSAPTELSAAQAAMWAESVRVVSETTPGADAAEQLTQLNEYFGNLKLTKGRRLKQKMRELEERRSAFGEAALGAEQIEQLTSRLEAAKAWESAAALRRRKAELGAQRATITTPGALDELEAEVARLSAEAAELVTTYSALIEAERESERALIRGSAFLDALEVAITHCDADGHSPCLLCGNPEFAPVAARDAIEPRVADRRVQLGEAKVAMVNAGKARATAESALQIAQMRLSQAQRAKADAEGSLRNIDLQTSEVDKALAVVKAPESYVGPEAEVLAAQLQSLRQAEAIRAELEREEAYVAEVERERDDAKECELRSKKLLNQALVKTQAAAEAAVNRYMVPGFQAKLDLAKCAWNVVGTDGRPHSKHVACGAELGALMLALGVAWTDGTPLRILVLDDADIASFDPVNMRAFLGVVQQAVADGLLTQAFVGWSRPDEVPAGWSMVVTDGDGSVAVAPVLPELSVSGTPPPPPVVVIPPPPAPPPVQATAVDILLSPGPVAVVPQAPVASRPAVPAPPAPPAPPVLTLVPAPLPDGEGPPPPIVFPSDAFTGL